MFAARRRKVDMVLFIGMLVTILIIIAVIYAVVIIIAPLE